MRQTMMSHLETGFVPYNGTSIYYEAAGDGLIPLVMLHAGIADHRMWDDQIAAFSEHYRVIHYDRRGFGNTRLVNDHYAHHEDLFALLNFLSVGQAHLMGCSQGGKIALDFALTYPTMAKSLTMVGSSPGGFEFQSDPPKQWDEIVSSFEANDLDRTSELEVQVWVDGPHRTPDQVDKLVRDKVRAMNLIALRNEKLEIGEELPFDPPAVNRLDEINIPTLILYGDLDVARVPAAGDMMADKIAGAKKIVMEGTAHMPNMERPQEFNDHILTFLNSL